MGIEAIAAVVVAVAAVTTTAYTLSKGNPEPPDLSSLKPRTPAALPPPPPKPAPSAPDKTLEEGDQKARQKAAQAFRELEKRSSGASTILTSPLGISTPPGNVSSSVLGRAGGG